MDFKTRTLWRVFCFVFFLFCNSDVFENFVVVVLKTYFFSTTVSKTGRKLFLKGKTVFLRKKENCLFEKKKNIEGFQEFNKNANLQSPLKKISFRRKFSSSVVLSTIEKNTNNSISFCFPKCWLAFSVLNHFWRWLLFVCCFCKIFWIFCKKILVEVFNQLFCVFVFRNCFGRYV